MNVRQLLAISVLLVLSPNFLPSICAADAPGPASEGAAEKIPVVSDPEIWKDPATANRRPRAGSGAPNVAGGKGVASHGQSAGDSAAGDRRLQPSQRMPARRGQRRRHRLSAGHRHGRDVGRAADSRRSRRHRHRGARQAQRLRRASTTATATSYFGLTFWTPNINIFRDPRWGRGQETYGEDPFLTARIRRGVHPRACKGTIPNYLKAMACAKHFAVHSGPECQRHRFNVEPSERDLYETYLPHFEAAVREGARRRRSWARTTRSTACRAAQLRFCSTDLLRKQWGFDGLVVLRLRRDRRYLGRA